MISKLKNPKVIYGIILAVAGGLFFLAIKNLFFFDEDILLVNNKSDFLAEIWQRSVVCKITFLLDNYLYGDNPLGYHVTNIIFHLADSVLAMLVLNELLKLIANYLTSFQLTAIPIVFFVLFLFTPIHSEPVCSILARGGSVVTFFCLLSVLFYLRSQLRDAFLIMISIFSFLLALFSYEVSWTLPFIILGITIFRSFVQGLPLKTGFSVVLLFFVVFVVWFVVKVVVVDKLVVTDYKDDNLLKMNWIILLKNSIVLFLRNFIPPFKSTAVFLSVGSIFIVTLAIGLVYLFKINKRLLSAGVLLLILTVMGFLPTSLLGIDSHDSESERYIYFSSVFAIMLLAVVLVVTIKNRLLLSGLFFLLCVLYGTSLFKTMNYYEGGSRLSKNYLYAIAANKINKPSVFMINLPTQYHGALLFRARSRMDSNTRETITTLNEFMAYLYPQHENKSRYITLSSKEVQYVPSTITVINKPLDSINYYYSAAGINFNETIITTDKGKVINFIRSEAAVVALEDSTLFIFK